MYLNNKSNLIVSEDSLKEMVENVLEEDNEIALQGKDNSENNEPIESFSREYLIKQ